MIARAWSMYLSMSLITPCITVSVTETLRITFLKYRQSKSSKIGVLKIFWLYSIYVCPRVLHNYCQLWVWILIVFLYQHLCCIISWTILRWPLSQRWILGTNKIWIFLCIVVNNNNTFIIHCHPVTVAATISSYYVVLQYVYILRV